MKRILFTIAVLMLAGTLWAGGITSIDTGLTIMKVRSAMAKDTPFIVGASYEGTMVGLNYDGSALWETPLSGYMVHDVWCSDLTGDGIDEILVANADGKLYCLSATGKVLWKFEPNDGGHLPPMYAVCVVHDGKKTPYVVCGGFDQSFYYLSSKGQLVKEMKSSDYSTMTVWGQGKEVGAPDRVHNVNFLRPLLQSDGSEILVLHVSNNHMQGTGAIYQFKPLADEPFRITPKVKAPAPIGEFHVCDPDGDGSNEILLGTSSLGKDALVRFDPVSESFKSFSLKKIGSAGYRVAQATIIPDGDSFRYFVISGSYIVTVAPDLDPKSAEKIAGRYAFNDMWRDSNGRILLASSQSGGSCIHIIDTMNPDWKSSFSNLNPPGKIQSILTNADACRDALSSFEKPQWQRETLPVYLTWAKKAGPAPEGVVANLVENYKSPVFLHRCSTDKEDWDRSTLGSELFAKKRDRRMKYRLTQQEVLDKLIPNFDDGPGIAYWVGHGNDPYMYQLETTKKVLDAAKGKKTVLILPELEHSTGEHAFVITNLFYPMADYAAQKNGSIYFRSKNIFWNGVIYEPAWKHVVSGKYASSIVPSMEETTDKTMELSLSGRIGLWAAGSVDSWGMRCSRDNPSFDRSRQHSYQRLPNHFLRTMVYSLAYGSDYLNNTYVDMDHMGLALELVAKGALFVPKREEIVSFSPVHFSMKAPDEYYIKDGTTHKWTTFYDRTFEEKNPFVFGRLNDTWPAAPNTAWDFSRIAAGVIDRRQSFIPPYNNGFVLITPPQKGIFADTDAPRGKLTDHLHPMYKTIMKEYITDGRSYVSPDGKKSVAADVYSAQVETALQNGAEMLPVSVEGNVGWVCAQVAPKHLRLTLVDGGYLNPSDKTVKVTFNTVSPIQIRDVLNQETFEVSENKSVELTVPCGLFRFMDIELSEAL